MLIELSKVHAPSLLLSEFNYYFNKAINQYINKRYNIYDVNLQTTDDIRVLKATTILTPNEAYAEDESEDKVSSYLGNAHPVIANLLGATYEVILPNDYLHILNCVCIFQVTKTWKCYDAGSYVQFGAKLLTSDSWATIITDFYNRPTPERPYYYIHNVNSADEGDFPTNPFEENDGGSGTDMVGIYNVTSNGEGKTEGDYSELDGSNLPRTLKAGGVTVSTVERATAYRYGNASQVRMEIRYGKIL